MALPRRPYLLRALYEWIVDSGLTPHVVVAAADDEVQVPADYVNDGQIVLNLAPRAVRDLNIGNERLTFSGRFGGRAFSVDVPVVNVLAVYARETGEGMMFPEEESSSAEAEASSADSDSPDAPRRSDGAPVLKVIK